MPPNGNNNVGENARDRSEILGNLFSELEACLEGSELNNSEEALDIYEWIMEKDPDFQAAREFKGWTLLMMGDYDGAITIFKSIKGEATHAIKPNVQLGYAYALKGDEKKANYFLNELKELSIAKPDGEYDLDFATLYTGLKMFDEAFFHLDKCLAKRLGPIIFINASPIWEPLKSDKRFNNLLKTIGLTKG